MRVRVRVGCEWVRYWVRVGVRVGCQRVRVSALLGMWGVWVRVGCEWVHVGVGACGVRVGCDCVLCGFMWGASVCEWV